MTDSKDKALNTAKRVKLQTRISTLNEQKQLINLFGKEISFLDPETSLALWNKIVSSCLWNGKFPYSNFKTIEFGDNYMSHLDNIANCFNNTPTTIGYCFPMNWSSSGVLLVDLPTIAKKLNKSMFQFNDELRFYSPDLTKSIHLIGDRSGSWDQLNELSISVFGGDWVKKIENLNSAGI